MSKLRHVVYNHVCILDESQSGVPYLKMRQISLKEIQIHVNCMNNTL